MEVISGEIMRKLLLSIFIIVLILAVPVDGYCHSNLMAQKITNAHSLFGNAVHTGLKPGYKAALSIPIILGAGVAAGAGAYCFYCRKASAGSVTSGSAFVIPREVALDCTGYVPLALDQVPQDTYLYDSNILPDRELESRFSGAKAMGLSGVISKSETEGYMDLTTDLFDSPSEVIVLRTRPIPAGDVEILSHPASICGASQTSSMAFIPFIVLGAIIGMLVMVLIIYVLWDKW